MSFVPLARDSACTNCRRRKIRCDGQKPKCSPCLTSDVFNDCAYKNGGTTEVQSLEDQISVLEARIQELQSGKTSTTPKTTGHDLQRMGSEVYLQAPSSTVQVSASGFQDIPPVLSQMLLHSFMHKSCGVGFFLNKERFKRSLAMNAEGEMPTFALLNTSYLWGTHLSSSKNPPGQEGILVSRALQSSAHALELFLFSGRILEGKYHTTAAASLVLSSGAHKIRSSFPDASGYLATFNVNTFSEPSDAIDEGERINAFWAVLTLDTFWNTVHGVPSSIPYTTPMARVDTPWPRIMEEYTQASFDPRFRSSHTIERFLSGVLDYSIPDSPKANFPRAAILFEHATFTGIQLFSIDILIQRFLASKLPPDPAFEAPLDYQFCMYSLAHAADIQLHLPFASQIDISRTRIFTAAKAIVNLIDTWGHVLEEEYINPMLAIIWTIACKVFLDKGIRMQYFEARALFERVMAAMERHPFPLMKQQLAQVKEASASCFPASYAPY
ncbi:hypothetical protein BT96DRAFT_994640 [Gymnopus androsaceus JB14]|uniref:Zn(2)-C6 fungal-type domain-containing protein n=1 Tax=Gymnopus androsaceus JB14 TaxID=1447944 RepID=A0A6A4HNU5_9AGAR|nr:hypothetical protein BT96DRAFT_994640 [Gymnopus androsaceus JB14]